MPRLFVAVDLPTSAAAELARLRPAAPGVAPVPVERLHLTLHFLGETPLDPAAAALAAVMVPSFDLTVTATGQFTSPGGVVTLWAGVAPSAHLLHLHAAVADALAGTGFRPEARAYTPHVSLARCEPTADPAVTADFLARHAEFTLPGVRAATFGLVASTFAAGGPVYRCERRYALG